jgi:hypothetical protein
LESWDPVEQYGSDHQIKTIPGKERQQVWHYVGKGNVEQVPRRELHTLASLRCKFSPMFLHMVPTLRISMSPHCESFAYCRQTSDPRIYLTFFLINTFTLVSRSSTSFSTSRSSTQYGCHRPRPVLPAQVRRRESGHLCGLSSRMHSFHYRGCASNVGEIVFKDFRIR